MRIRTTIAAAATVVITGACSAPSPPGDASPPDPPAPLGAVDRAQEVADQVEQRQADIEAQLAELSDPFNQP